jgi:hypothetical protein
MRTAILWISAVGATVFSAAMVVSIISPISIESLAREALRIEIHERVSERIESLDESNIVGA